MNGRAIAARAPILLVLSIVLTAIATRSSLAKLLPFPIAAFPALLWLFLAILVALIPSLFARETPLPAAAVVTVPILAAASYGASRLDWLRVLKDFGVAEASAIDPLRFTLEVLALVLLWALHAIDLSVRLRGRAADRGIPPADASAASRRVATRSAQALGIALGGAAGLLALGIAGLAIGAAIPTERAALVAPLLAAALIVGAALYVARGSAE